MTSKKTSSTFQIGEARHEKLAEAVARQILEAISDLEPGTRLPSERELTATLNVGRSTVREALNGLSLVGAIEVRHGQGIFVTKHNSGFAATDAIAKAVEKGVTHDLIEVREIVEVAAARLAAARRTEADLEEFARELTLHRRMMATGEHPIEPSSRFHLVLAEAAHNEILAGVIGFFYNSMVERGQVLYDSVPNFDRLEVDEHQMIHDAIKDGDADEAARAAAQHVASVAQAHRQVGQL